VLYGDVDGNVRMGCSSAEIHGHVGGNLSVDACCIELAGPVDGDAELKAETITILPGCLITGNLKYTSAKGIDIPEGAQVGGEISWAKPEAKAEAPRRKGLQPFRMFLHLTMMVGQMAIGLILIGLSRKHVAFTANTLTGHPWKSLALGFVVWICVPIAALILMVTIIGLPLAILVIFLYLIAWYLSAVLVGLTLGGKIVGAFKKDRAGPMVGGLILGLVVLRALSLIPGLGLFIQFLVILFGMGALILSRKTLRDQAVEKGLI